MSKLITSKKKTYRVKAYIKHYVTYYIDAENEEMAEVQFFERTKENRGRKDEYVMERRLVSIEELDSQK